VFGRDIGQRRIEFLIELPLIVMVDTAQELPLDTRAMDDPVVED